jgi:uncharacterized membrane-anchored protein YhcB (DUF1043 family)
MFRFTLGLLLGLSISVAYAQLYPGISPDQRDMTLERYWRQQQFDQQRDRDEHFLNENWNRKPC